MQEEHGLVLYDDGEHQEIEYDAKNGEGQLCVAASSAPKTARGSWLGGGAVQGRVEQAAVADRPDVRPRKQRRVSPAPMKSGQSARRPTPMRALSAPNTLGTHKGK